jgi:hypothetical protein
MLPGICTFGEHDVDVKVGPEGDDRLIGTAGLEHAIAAPAQVVGDSRAHDPLVVVDQNSRRLTLSLAGLFDRHHCG